MNKGDVLDQISQNLDHKVNRTDIDKVVSEFFNVVADAVSHGDKVTIPGWISFEQVERAAREGRNPATGETLQIPARKAVKVSAGSKLKNAVQG